MGYSLRLVTLGRAGLRGLVGAMAMTGVRDVTTHAGLLERSPPEAIMVRHAPQEVQQLPGAQRRVVTELAHWAYGATGGAVFGLLPLRVRASPWIGPVYGLSVWLVFEAGVAPLLGVRHVHRRQVLGRVLVAVDHALYGVVVSGRLAPEPEVITATRGQVPWAKRTMRAFLNGVHAGSFVVLVRGSAQVRRCETSRCVSLVRVNFSKLLADSESSVSNLRGYAGFRKSPPLDVAHRSVGGRRCTRLRRG
ncbi:MAG: hypothetical protein ACRDPK_12515 [Carbonactinosporaceae bacterium]